MLPPASVNLTAFCSTFDTTCTKRVGSALMSTGTLGIASRSETRPAVSEAWFAWTAALTSVTSDVGWRCSRILPDVMRDTSSRSSTSRTSWPSCSSIMERTSSTAPGRSPASRISSRLVRSGASGFRSSWASVARNSSLRRSASFSSRSFRRSASSACVRSIRSAA